eukprot:m.150185 g.150185  ORF g.150185 m.150185 type:complete len:171 (+) comp38547_c0_seq5:86-598(+)
MFPGIVARAMLEKNRTSNKSALRLDVRICRGHNLQEGWRERVDEVVHRNVNSYVGLEVERPAEGYEDFSKQRTAVKAGFPNPDWNEDFSFVVPDQPKKRGKLFLSVWFKHIIRDSQCLNRIEVDLNALKVNDQLVWDWNWEDKKWGCLKNTGGKRLFVSFLFCQLKKVNS